MAEVTKHHYHATLICGHKMSFDLADDLEAITAEQDNVDGYEVVLPCRDCGETKTSLIVDKVGLASDPCECKDP